MNPALIAAGIDFAGNLLGGIGANSQAKKDRRESARQFNLTYGLQREAADREAAQYGARRKGLAATTPMREQLLQKIMQRFGMPTTTPPIAPPQGAGMSPRPTPTPMPAPDPGAALREQLMQLMGAMRR